MSSQCLGSEVSVTEVIIYREALKGRVWWDQMIVPAGQFVSSSLVGGHLSDYQSQVSAL